MNLSAILPKLRLTIMIIMALILTNERSFKFDLVYQLVEYVRIVTKIQIMAKVMVVTDTFRGI